MNTPTEKIAIKLQGNSYETEFTVGKVIDSEKYRAFYSGGFYKTFNSNLALDLVDIISYLRAFFPQAEEDLKVKSFLDLKPIQIKEIRKQMTEKFFPWYQDWVKQMQEIEKVELKEDKKEND